jgi:hypothetical protein
VLGAILLFIMALAWWPVAFWLIFPAIGLGSRGMRVVGRHAVVSGTASGTPQQVQIPQAQSSAAAPSQAQQRAQRFGTIGAGRNDVADAMRGPFPAASAPARGAPPQQDPRDVRVDRICDKLLAELRTSPETVKDIFIKPEETVQALRATCRDLTRRERELRKFLSPDEDVRLTTERAALQKRIDGEVDEVTKMRLASALAALDQQREQRAELGRAAARFDAEHTRISYTLESLYTQVVRMRSADSSSVDVAGAGLRRSLDLLSHEVNALADALERVNSGADSSRMKKVAEAPATGGEGGGPGTPGTREKA